MSHLLLLATEEPNGFLLSSDLNEVDLGIDRLLHRPRPADQVRRPGDQDGDVEPHRAPGQGARRLPPRPRPRPRPSWPTCSTASPTPATSASGSSTRRPPTAASLKAQLQAKAEQDAAELVARATADVEASKGQALADLQADAASLALGAAEAVVNRNLDAATQTDLIERYISQVGAQS